MRFLQSLAGRSRWAVLTAALLAAALPSTAGAQLPGKASPASEPRAATNVPPNWQATAALPGARAPEEQAWLVLESASRSGNADSRVMALQALSSLGPQPRVVAIIESGLRDHNAVVRQAAAEALGGMQWRPSAAKIRPLLKDKSNEVVFSAARALSQLGDPAGREMLIEFATGERRAKASVAQMAGDWAKAQTSPRALLLTGASYGAAALLGPYSAGVFALVGILTNRSSDVRIQSAQALGDEGSERAVSVLEKELHDKDWKVRAAAAEALGAAGAVNAIPQLAPLLHDHARAVRLLSATSILHLQQVQQQEPQPAVAPAAVTSTKR